jgi:LacI family transcriptional regulator
VSTRRSTIDDVAEAAGVARVTVSRVLNNEQNVRPETREKVRRAVEALGYSVNTQARALATGSGRQIMLIHAHSPETEPNSYYDAGLELGALRACLSLGFELVTRAIDPSSDDRAGLLDSIFRRDRPIGVIVSPPLSDDLQLIAAASEAGVQMVAVSAGPEAGQRVAAVGIDERAAGRAIGEYLVSLGHRRFGFVNGPKDHQSAALRLEGFREALRAGGIDENPWLASGDFTFRSGAEAAERLLSDGALVTALACANDDMAAGAMLSLHRAGIEIPGDISVTGFDGTPMSEVMWPPLTTILQPIKDFTERAVHILAANGGEGTQSETLPHQLIVRESTAPPIEP